MSMKSFKDAHRYPGGIVKYLYDQVAGNESGDEDLARRVEHLESLSTSTVSFTVKDSESEPAAVSGAKVTLDGKTGTTGSGGGCNIQGVLWGKYTVTVTKTGFDDYSAEITVDGSHTSFNISLTTASG